LAYVKSISHFFGTKVHEVDPQSYCRNEHADYSTKYMGRLGWKLRLREQELLRLMRLVNEVTKVVIIESVSSDAHKHPFVLPIAAKFSRTCSCCRVVVAVAVVFFAVVVERGVL